MTASGPEQAEEVLPRDGAEPADVVASRYGLGEAQAAQLAELLACLAEDPRAPTTVRDPAQAAERHLADSLEALEFDHVRRAGRIADLGSGAGFPGLALAVAVPTADVALVESVTRKADFIDRAIARARIANARSIRARAEEWRGGLRANDLVTARALAAPAVVVEYAAPLLVAGGALVDWRGRLSEEERESALAAGRIVGLELGEVRKVQPFPTAENRYLYLYLKVRATPERFPRRSGLAAKRPLAGRGAADTRPGPGGTDADSQAWASDRTRR